MPAGTRLKWATLKLETYVLSEFIFILRMTRNTAIVIIATLGEQHRKNSSISSSEQLGFAVIVLNPKYVIRYPKINRGIEIDKTFLRLKYPTSFVK